MEPFAEMGCVLKVNPQCDACKMKMMELLSSIIGVYSVTMDAPQGLVNVSGEVDPNRLLNALATIGKHGEVVWASLKHPQVSRTRTITRRANYYHAPGNNTYNHYYPSNYIAPGPAAYYSRAYNNNRWYDGALEDPSYYYYNRAYNNNRWYGSDAWDTYDDDQYYCPIPGPAAYYSRAYNNNRWYDGALEDPSYYYYNRAYNNNRWYGSDAWDTYDDDQYYCPMMKEVPTSGYYYNYHDGRDLPPARYVPSYRPPEYNPYEDEPINLCTIM